MMMTSTSSKTAILLIFKLLGFAEFVSTFFFHFIYFTYFYLQLSSSTVCFAAVHSWFYKPNHKHLFRKYFSICLITSFKTKLNYVTTKLYKKKCIAKKDEYFVAKQQSMK